MPARGLRPSLPFVLVLLARASFAQEALEDQDPIEPDWAPAWDTPLWPASTGAVLEIAGGRQSGQVPLPLGDPGWGPRGQVARGDYVLALLTLPLGGPLRPPQSTMGDALAGDEDAATPDDPQASEPPAAARTRPGTGDAAPPEPTASERQDLQGPAPRRAAELPLELLEDTVEQAEKAAGFGSSLRSLTSVRQRARWSGLAPELRLRGVTGIDQTRSVDSAGLVPSDETLRDGSDSLVEIRLTFHLEKLLHSGQEVALERARQQILAERAELRQTVGRELVSYVRARRRLEREVIDEEDWERAELAAEQARLSLYLLTGGWFRGEATVERYDGAASGVRADRVRGEPK